VDEKREAAMVLGVHQYLRAKSWSVEPLILMAQRNLHHRQCVTLVYQFHACVRARAHARDPEAHPVACEPAKKAGWVMPRGVPREDPLLPGAAGSALYFAALCDVHRVV
jgi:hypothetical protein